jgi:hypothetical protein
MLIEKVIQYEETPEAIQYFSRMCDKLTDYGYWFLLSTLWVSYTGWSDLEQWKLLFSSQRPKRKKSIMKPSELQALEALPYHIEAYRAPRPGEQDWISYTLSLDTAAKFATRRRPEEIVKYQVRKRDVLALFLRRGEQELIVLDKSLPKVIERIECVYTDTERYKEIMGE